MNAKLRWKPTHTIVVSVVVHIIVAVFLGMASENRPAISSGLFISLIFCQTSLVGMWSGLGAAPWPWRLAVLLAGIAWLSVLLGWGINEVDFEIVFLVALSTLLVAVVAWTLRFLRIVSRQVGTALLNTREGLQFSIRHLLLLTLAVGCLLTLGRVLAPYLRGSRNLAEVSILALCFVCVALTSLWAMLGLGRPALRSLATLAIAGGAGWVIAAAFGYDRAWFWTWLPLLQATFLAASLLVVRKCGYRLISMRGARE